MLPCAKALWGHIALPLRRPFSPSRASPLFERVDARARLHPRRVCCVRVCRDAVVPLAGQGWMGWMAVSSALGIVMTYSTVLCNSYNSPLATAVTGNVKDMISTAIGAFVRKIPAHGHT